MALTLPTAKTFTTMLQELRSRLKLHATLGTTPALNSILTEANEYVFGELDDGLPYQSTLTLAANTPTYPFETDEGLPVARGSVHSVWIEQGDSCRVPLPQGITHAHRADAALRSIPQRYDTLLVDDEFTLEVWPTPDQAYVLHVDHNRVLTRFEQGADKPSAPARLVLAYAIATGKAHYGQPDANIAGQAFKTMLTNEKERQRENRRFLPALTQRRTPQVVVTANGYRQVG